MQDLTILISQTGMIGGTMRGKSHPEHADEVRRLSQTVSGIDAEIAAIDSRRYDGMTPGASRAKALSDRARKQDLAELRRAPYFMRVDAQLPWGPERLYFGKFPVPEGEFPVTGWQSPLARLRFSSERRQSVTTPKGVVVAELELQRKLTVSDCQLQDLQDIVDYRGAVSDSEVKAAADNAERVREAQLVEALGVRDDKGLRDIVETMQERQDRLIREPFERILVVRGVAGSGKTSIAYHRLAYFLYEENRKDLGIDPDRCIVFAPNRLFLSYVKNLLPELGVRGVRQTTFEEWALALMGLNPETFVVRDVTLERLLDRGSSREDRDAAWRRATLLASPRIYGLMLKFVDTRAASADFTEDLTVTELIGGRLIDARVRRNRVNEIYERTVRESDPLFRRIEMLKGRLLDELERELERTPRAIRGPGDGIAEGRAARWEAVSKYVESAWRPLRLPGDYKRLMRDPSLLGHCACDTFDGAEIEDLLRTPPLSNRELDREDVAALLALHVAYRGAPDVRFDHVVIDEAQDMSPLQFELLQQFATRRSLTILGDPLQSIHSYRGLTDLTDLEEVFLSSELQVENVLENYRSTKEIVEFANQLARQAWGDSAVLAVPTGRSGSRPKVYEFIEAGHMYDELAECLASDMERGRKTMAVIGKDDQDCREAFHELEERGIRISHNWVDEQGEYAGGIAILTVAAAKGLEFESVYVIHADAEGYAPNSAFDARLLYVAVTRALDRLEVMSVGESSSLLDAPQRPDIAEARKPGSRGKRNRR